MATILRGQQAQRGGRLQSTKDGYVFTEQRVYVVVSDILDDTPLNVIATAGLPVVGLTPTSSGAVCRSLDPRQDRKQPRVWYVTADFSTEPLNQKTDPGGTPNPDPTTWIPIYRGVIETYDKVMFKDRNGLAYVNSAGDKFPEPLKKKKPITVYEFSQYEAPTVTDKQIGDRTDSTNNATFKGFPAWTLWLMVKDFERGFYFGYEAVKINYRVAYKPDDWKDRPLDMGYTYRPSAGAALTTSPILVALNSNGTKKPDTDPPAEKVFEGLNPINFSSFLRS